MNVDESPPQRLPTLGELDPPDLRRRSSHNIKCFSHWIEAEPKEKWALLYGTVGARYVESFSCSIFVAHLVRGINQLR